LNLSGVSVDKSQVKKRRKVHYTSATVGNKFRPRCKSSTMRQTVGKILPVKPLPTAQELINILNECTGCCKRPSCFRHYFQKTQQCVETGEIQLNDLTKAGNVIADCRNELRGLSDHQRQLWLAAVLKQSVRDTGHKRKFVSKTGVEKQVPVFSYNFKITRNGVDIPLCPTAWGLIHGFTKHMMSNISKVIKSQGVEKPLPTGDWSKTSNLKESTRIPLTTCEVEQIFGDVLGEDYGFGDDFVTGTLSPFQETNHMASIWIQDYFETVADHSPNSRLKKVSLSFKEELYKIYQKDFDELSMNFVSLNTFLALWRECFPTFLMRKYCGIPGKCSTCAAIDALHQEKGASVSTKRAARQCHVLHRGGMFMLERKSYLQRKLRAVRNKSRILSVVIDGMDQSHSRLPYLGVNNSFDAALQQHLTGVLIHGYNLQLYRNFDNVSKGADLTIFCFLSALQTWRAANKGRWPEEIYLQVDGASDNANKYVLGMCELLVAKKMAKKVVFSRLPVGHTHGDIDACFGHLWKFLRAKVCVTVGGYQAMLDEKFKNAKLAAKVIDVYVVPDYMAFLEDCIDEKLSNLHKEENTQLQWKFESVPVSFQYPLGVKTSWRAYCSDR